jgi:pimeloyl-ACP methyl ester carboxylesterase
MSRKWTTGFVDGAGLKLHFYRTGGDKPPLLLAHGLSDNGLCWTRLAKALEADYDLIMLDARGHGLSDKPDSGYSPQTQADDVAAAARALGLEKPALLGHSMGAVVATLTAAQYPDLLSCVLLEDPPWLPSPDATTLRLMAEMGEMWQEELSVTQTQTIEQIIRDGRAANPGRDESEWQPWAESKKQMSLSTFEQMGSISDRWQEAVAAITCPILLLTADPRAGAFASREVATLASQLWRQGEVAHCNGAGHSIRRERFDCYLEAVAGFLDKHTG